MTSILSRASMPQPLVRRAASFVFAAVVAIVMARSPSAEACSGPFCTQAEFFPARGTVPANLPAVVWWPIRRDGPVDDEADPVDALRFVRFLADGGTEDVPFRAELSTETRRRTNAFSPEQSYRIIPNEPLQVGARYALWSSDCLGPERTEAPRTPSLLGTMPPSPARYAVFDVGEAAPLPTRLGDLGLESPRAQPLRLAGGASCSYDIEAVTVTASVSMPPTPWLDAMAFRTIVDGQRYLPSPEDFSPVAYGYSWVGRAQDLLAATCAGDTSGPLVEGRHTVRFEATVAGTDSVLTTETATFELSCDAVSGDDEGCTCVAHRSGPGGYGWLFLAGLGLVLRRRRFANASGR